MPSDAALKASDVVALGFLLKWYPKQHPAGMAVALASLLDSFAAKEREACAKIVESVDPPGQAGGTTISVAAAIRARGEDA